MAMFKKLALTGAAIATSLMVGSVAQAAGSNYDFDYKMKHPQWHFAGPFGSYDKAAMQRGYQVYREVCAACHQLKYLSFRHLGDKGAPYYDARFPNPNDNPYVKAFAADFMIRDIDSETGDPIMRPGIPADRFPSPFPNDIAAKASNGGAMPPDLSVMVKARTGGADYMYNLLVAYSAEKPEGMKMSPGTHYNPVMEGGAIAMAAPLSDGLVEYADGTEATVSQMSKDVTEFLAWSADPKMAQRKSLGLGTMLYLLILSILMWFSYKAVWKNIKH